MDKVVVVSKLGKVWFRYNSKLVGGKKFFCLGYVVIDLVGYIIVVDFNNICLYILICLLWLFCLYFGCLLLCFY